MAPFAFSIKKEGEDSAIGCEGDGHSIATQGTAFLVPKFHCHHQTERDTRTSQDRNPVVPHSEEEEEEEEEEKYT